jgi:hypothetical protein
VLKKITLSAKAELINRARQAAKAQRKTLNQVFREWLVEYTQWDGGADAINALYQRLWYVNSGGRKFTRDELNER